MLTRTIRTSVLHRYALSSPSLTTVDKRFKINTLNLNSKQFQHTQVLNQETDILDDPSISPRLKTSDEYVYRHMGNSKTSSTVALNTLGLNTMEELINEVVPEDIRLPSGMAFKHQGKELKGIDSETVMLKRMRMLKDANKVYKTYIG